jgi:hypothetical protein
VLEPVAAAAAAEAVIHPVYLPFSRSTLRQHFADVRSGGADDRHLRYYVESAQRALTHAPVHAAHRESTQRARMYEAVEHQVEKDERFWIVSALLAAFHSDDRIAALTSVLAASLGATPPFDGPSGWSAALGPADELRLFFEANLPSPRAYTDHLSSLLGERSLIPWLRESALSKQNLEGATKVDAILVAPSTGFAVVFEAKVLSDTSCHTSYDAIRNQIARNIDVLLERHPGLMPPLDAPEPDRTCFVLVTPQLFLDNPGSRLYGRLMQDYRKEPATLSRDLPHRDPAALSEVASRLGWTSWERIHELVPRACPWLNGQ